MSTEAPVRARKRRPVVVGALGIFLCGFVVGTYVRFTILREPICQLLTGGVGLLLGAILSYLAVEPSLLKQKDRNQQPQPHAPWAFTGSASADHIKFLYDKRLTLFNTRREHEWKIYFGAMVLLGGVDTALVTRKVILTGCLERGLWALACLIILAVQLGYQSRLQNRNTADRKAMGILQNWLCDIAGIATDSPVREGLAGEKKLPSRPAWGWAFPWQMALFITVAVASAALPWFVDP